MRRALVEFCEVHLGIAEAAEPDPKDPTVSIETIFRALDLVPTPILVGMNPETTDIRSNAAGHILFGGGDRNLSQSAAEAERPDFKVYSDGRLVPPDELPMQRAAATGKATQAPECELRFDDGTVKFIRGRAVPVFNSAGEVRGSIGVFLDVTEVREAEKRHALMTEEVKHRAKNALTLVSAVANFTLRAKLPADVFEDFEARLRVIGSSVDVFSHSPAPSRSVREAIAETLTRQIGPDLSRVKLNGPELSVSPTRLVSLNMAIHELATNAFKYGALSTPQGRVTVEWSTLDGVEVLRIDWVESGGPKVTPPLHRGFGSRLLAQVLGNPAGRKAQMNFKEDGLECRLYVGID